MPNITEKIQSEFGRNERWQDRSKRPSPNVPITGNNPYIGKSRLSRQDRKLIEAAKKRLDPKKF